MSCSLQNGSGQGHLLLYVYTFNSLLGAIVTQITIYWFWKLVLALLWCFHTIAALNWIDLTGTAANDKGCSKHLYLHVLRSALPGAAGQFLVPRILFKPAAVKTEDRIGKCVAAEPCL